MADRDRPAAYGSKPVAFVLAGGESVTCWKEGDDVVLAVDLGGDRNGAMVRMPAPCGAYLAGLLASMSGVHGG